MVSGRSLPFPRWNIAPFSDKGIIDPTKVTRNALMNAASISALFITTEAGVASIPEPEKEAPMPQGMY